VISALMKAPFQSPAGAAGTDFSQAEIIVARNADIKGGAGGADFRQFHTDAGTAGAGWQPPPSGGKVKGTIASEKFWAGVKQ